MVRNSAVYNIVAVLEKNKAIVFNGGFFASLAGLLILNTNSSFMRMFLMGLILSLIIFRSIIYFRNMAQILTR